MEGLFESLIYLIIAVVILVLSMRKKRPDQVKDKEDAGTTGMPEDIFKDEEEYDVKPQPVTATERAQGESVSWMSESEARDKLMDSDEVLKEASENNPIAQFESQSKADAYGINQPEDREITFDLKRAVIYKEILERRTF